MTQQDEALIYLVRCGIQSEFESHIDLANLDWRILINLSFEQGVAAVAVDGLQKIYESNPSLELEIDKPEFESLKYEWFASTFQAEDNYSRQRDVLAEIVAILSDHQIRVLLLKGLGLSDYYPVPNHRPTGDLDLYPYGFHLEADSLFKSMGVNVDCNYPKHSVFEYKGFTVENHYTYLNAFQTKCERRVQKFLESLDDDLLADGGHYTPSPLKNYFFLLCHMARHFSEFESVKLRHLLDWGLFLKAEASGLDLQLVRSKLKEFRLEKTNDLFVSLAERVCGLDFSNMLIERLSKDECEHILEYILAEKKREIPEHLIPRFFYKLKTLAGNYWKFHYLSITMRERVWYSLKYHIAGKVEV